jgi:hypothetical protein
VALLATAAAPAKPLHRVASASTPAGTWFSTPTIPDSVDYRAFGRSGPTSSEPTTTTLPPPPIPHVAGPLPRITITASARAANPAVTTAAARQIITDLIDDLAAERLALATNNQDLAIEVNNNPRLARLIWAIHVHGLTGTTEVRDFHFDRVTIGLNKPAGSSQDSPQLAVQAVGTVTVSTIDGYGASHPGPPQAFRGTFLVTETNRYVIDGV